MSHSLLEHPTVRFQLDALTAWFEAQLAYRELPGLAFGLVYDQTLLWSRGFGAADVARARPTTDQTVYRIASITKLFTATAILQLRDAGLLQLDDPIHRHLPWFAIQSDHADGPPITIRALLTHTSGLPREAGAPYWNDFNFPSRDQVRTTLPTQRTAFPVATQWKYSNLALTLAGEIVAAVAGQSYADYVHAQILAPLGMTQTYVLPTPDTPNLAVGYSRRLPGSLARAISPFTDTNGIGPSANMASCVEDLARFAMLQFRGGAAGGAQILSGHTLAEMHRVHWVDPDWKGGWGLGFRVMREEERTYVGHGGAVQGYRTQLLLSPADKVGVIVLTNADDGEPLGFASYALKQLIPALAQAQPKPTPAAVPDLVRYCGRYRSAWGDMQVLLHADKLAALYPAYPDPLADVVELTPVDAPHAFRIQGSNGYGANGELAVFELDASGQVARLRMGDTYMLPVAAW